MTEPITVQERYPMCSNQPAQIDCRVTTCKFYQGAGTCGNVSPAITLNASGMFVCWSMVAKDETPDD